MKEDENSISEPSRQLPVKAAYDVVVVGGGIAGVAAAVAAARAGVSVCLLEKENGLGGLATLGNVIVWLPICNGRGRQVIGGIGEEMLRLSVRDLQTENDQADFHGVPACWEKGGDKRQRAGTRFMTCFNPASYLLALEQWILTEGVHVMYDTRLCAVRRRRGSITHVIVENKSGRSAIACGTAVDASGDADLCYLAGEETFSSNANVAAGWFYYLKDGVIHLHESSEAFRADLDASKLTTPHYRGDVAEDVTAQLIETRKLALRNLDSLRKDNPDAAIEPFALPSIPCFRATRRLVGEQSLCETDMYRWYKDTVGLTGDWRRRGPVYPITLRMLRGVANKNLLAAGRCFSIDVSAWDAARCIPTCAISGEAAGLAAAVAAKDKGGNVHRISARSFQALMRKNGNILGAKYLARPDE